MTWHERREAPDDERRTRRIARLLVWTGAAVGLGAVVGLVYAVHPLVT